jgi:hypothetical protein
VRQLRRAAEKLRVSQPTLTAQIASMKLAFLPALYIHAEIRPGENLSCLDVEAKLGHVVTTFKT